MRTALHSFKTMLHHNIFIAWLCSAQFTNRSRTRSLRVQFRQKSCMCSVCVTVTGLFIIFVYISIKSSNQYYIVDTLRPTPPQFHLNVLHFWYSLFNSILNKKALALGGQSSFLLLRFFEGASGWLSEPLWVKIFLSNYITYCKLEPFPCSLSSCSVSCEKLISFQSCFAGFTAKWQFLWIPV